MRPLRRAGGQISETGTGAEQMRAGEDMGGGGERPGERAACAWVIGNGRAYNIVMDNERETGNQCRQCQVRLLSKSARLEWWKNADCNSSRRGRRSTNVSLYVFGAFKEAPDLKN